MNESPDSQVACADPTMEIHITQSRRGRVGKIFCRSSTTSPNQLPELRLPAALKQTLALARLNKNIRHKSILTESQSLNKQDIKYHGPRDGQAQIKSGSFPVPTMPRIRTFNYGLTHSSRALRIFPARGPRRAATSGLAVFPPVAVYRIVTPRAAHRTAAGSAHTTLRDTKVRNTDDRSVAAPIGPATASGIFAETPRPRTEYRKSTICLNDRKRHEQMLCKATEYRKYLQVTSKWRVSGASTRFAPERRSTPAWPSPVLAECGRRPRTTDSSAPAHEKKVHALRSVRDAKGHS